MRLVVPHTAVGLGRTLIDTGPPLWDTPSHNFVVEERLEAITGGKTSSFFTRKLYFNDEL